MFLYLLNKVYGLIQKSFLTKNYTRFSLEFLENALFIQRKNFSKRSF